MFRLSFVKDLFLKTQKISLCQICNYQVRSKSFSQLPKLNSKILLWRNIEFQNIRYFKSTPNTNVVQDVVLYNFVNNKQMNIVILFGVSQVLFWTYLGGIILTELRDTPVKGDEEGFFQKHNFGEYKWRLPLGFVCLSLAFGAFSVSFLYAKRLVTKVKLDKSGKTLTLLISGNKPWRQELIVPVKNVSAPYSRKEMKTFLPFKIKDKKLYYVLDMEGDIKNLALFDAVLGTKRNFK